MSRDLHIHCKTCDKPEAFEMPFCFADRLRSLIRHGQAIASFYAAFAMEKDAPAIDMELSLAGRPVDIEFFHDHASHELIVQDEYGQEM